MGKENPDHRIERAVSPVIGVILMVAITVILSAVIGAFVLEIGDQQETAPSASFDIEEEVKIFKGRASDPHCLGGCETNLTMVSMTHMGGDTIPISRLAISVDGNYSAYGDPNGVENYDPAAWPLGDPTIEPQPNYLKNRGTNKQFIYGSGDTFSVVGYGGLNIENLEPKNLYKERKLRWSIRDNGNNYCTEEDVGYYKDRTNVKYEDNNHPDTPYNPTVGLYSNPPAKDGWCNDDLDSGNDVKMIWRASSGGKTQTLIGYTVKQSNRNQ